MADTRKDKRAPVSLKVRFKSATVDEFIEHYSKDVSRGGIYIKSSQPMPVGTLLKFQLQLKDESALIRGVGRVVWTRAEEDAAAEQPAGMGIKFIKMDNESRAVVERIVDAHAPDQGTYERGRYLATSAEPAEAPAPAEAGAFFPDLPPAEQPPAEDRTAVRQAAQFLAAALSEGGTDEQAAREAQQHAAEARRRTEQIETERREAKARKRQEAADGGLPSMIIDPSLAPQTGRPAERAPPGETTPLPGPSDAALEAAARLEAERAAEREPDTEPPSLSPSPTSTTSIPQVLDPGRKSRALPLALIALLLLVGAIVAVRGGPRELLVESAAQEGEKGQEVPAAVAPAEPGAQAHGSETTAGEPSNAAEREGAAIAPPPSGATVRLEVSTTPRGAQVFVGDQLRGTAPLTLELPENAPAVVRARAPGYAEAREQLAPGKQNPPLKLKLKLLPYLVHVESSPAGASVNVAGQRGTAPMDVQLSDAPTTDLTVSARMNGYESARTRLSPNAFAENEGAMRASLNLTLTPVPPGVSGKEAGAATPRERPKKAPPAPKPEPVPSAPSEPEAVPPAAPVPAEQAAPAAEPAPPEPPKEEAPPPGPAPQQELPKNPFGE